MAHPTVEARGRRSLALSQRITGLRRSISPISSTGSCHGTVVSEGTASQNFSEIEKDIANGDIWNSTGELFFNTKDQNNDSSISRNIRSTAKKYGRWEPRRQNPTSFSASAIASAFPDFTSVGLDTNEEEGNTTAGKSISIEVPRGNKSQLYTSNIATSRQSPSRENPSTSNVNIQTNMINSSRQPPSKSISKNKQDAREINSADQKDPIMRSSLNKTVNTTSYISHASRTFKGDRRSHKALQPRIGDEMDNSIVAEEQTLTTTVASNSTNVTVNPLRYPSKTSLPSKSLRFLDIRGTSNSEEKDLPRKEGTANFSPEVRDNPTKSSHNHTPSKASKLSMTQTQTTDLTSSINRTQTGTSFLLPWSNNTHPNTIPVNHFPIFTAQGKVQTTRLPHEYVDSIDLPVEEEHIYDMIGNINHQNMKSEDLLRYLHQNENQTVEGSLSKSVRKRSDSGLGDSGSEISGRDNRNISSNSDRNISQYEKLIADLQTKLTEANDSKNDLETKCQHLVIKVKQLELTNSESLKRTETHRKERIEMNNTIRNLESEVQRLRNENNVLRRQGQKLDQDIQSLEVKNSKLSSKASNQNYDDIQQKNEIQSLKSQIEEIYNAQNALLESNKELAAQNWAQRTEIQELMEKVRQMTVNKHKMESEISSMKKEVKENISVIKNADTEMAQMEHEREREKAEWATKSRSYERQIEKLTTEKEELRTKLSRSEKCRRLLQSNTKRIMESTLQIETTRFTKTTKKSSSKKDKTSTMTEAVPLIQKEKTEALTKEIQIPCSSECQQNNNYTTDFGMWDGSDNETSTSTHFTRKHQSEANTNTEYTLDKSFMSNFSDLLGHNVAKNFRDIADNLEEIAKQRRAENNQKRHSETTENVQPEDTCVTINCAPISMPSQSVSITTQQRHHSETQTHHHTRSFSEHNFSVESQVTQTSVRRHTFPASNIKNKSSGTGNCAASNKVTENQKVEHPPLSAECKRVQKGTCEHEMANCTTCIRSHTREDAKKVTIHLQKPIPVSDRMPETISYNDEPTIRPSIQPGKALAFVIKTMKDQMTHLTMKYQELNEAYMKHDSSLGKKARKAMVISIESTLKEIEMKRDQIYSLYDVLEGLKGAGQEMTEDLLDFTLTNLGVADITWDGFDK